MRFPAWCAGLIGLALLVITPMSSAQAQASRTWISGVGDDANPCSRTAPCKTFPGAISKTATGGEINCLDPGGFGAVTITKSISLVCDFTEGGILSAGTNGVIINAPAGSEITLKGLDIECFGTGINGIDHLGPGTNLHIHKVQIRNCRGSNSNGILIAPSSGLAKVAIADSYITGNGNSPAVGGILVKPTGTGAATVTINRTQVETNTAGIRFDSTSGGAVQGTVRDSLIMGNSGNGISVIAGANASTVMLDHSSVVGNLNGLVTNGASATIRVNQTSITANGTGLLQNPNGTLATYKNNAVNGNATDGSFTANIVPE